MAAEAGAALRTVFHELDFGRASKGKEGPVTTADILSNYILASELGTLLPEAAFLSEETTDRQERLHKEWVWIVDPLDGTREFTEGVPEYSVSIGLAHRGRAVLGAIAIPEENLIIAGGEATGVHTARLPEESFLLRQHPDLHRALTGPVAELGNHLEKLGPATFSEAVELEKRPRRMLPDSLKDASIAVSQTEFRKGRFELFSDLKLQPSGSVARKMGLVAAGQYDLQWSLYPKNEWDLCGGVALLSGLPAFHCIELREGKDLVFNKENTRTYGLLAGPAPLVEELYAVFRAAGSPLYHLPASFS